MMLFAQESIPSNPHGLVLGAYVIECLGIIDWVAKQLGCGHKRGRAVM